RHKKLMWWSPGCRDFPRAAAGASLTGPHDPRMLDRVRVMHNRIAQRLAAAAALLSLAAASAATSGVWLRCRITGVMQPACCCPAADGADHAAPSPATAEAADCCDRVVTDV